MDEQHDSEQEAVEDAAEGVSDRDAAADAATPQEGGGVEGGRVSATADAGGSAASGAVGVSAAGTGHEAASTVVGSVTAPEASSGASEAGRESRWPKAGRIGKVAAVSVAVVAVLAGALWVVVAVLDDDRGSARLSGKGRDGDRDERDGRDGRDGRGDHRDKGARADERGGSLDGCTVLFSFGDGDESMSVLVCGGDSLAPDDVAWPDLDGLTPRRFGLRPFRSDTWSPHGWSWDGWPEPPPDVDRFRFGPRPRRWMPESRWPDGQRPNGQADPDRRGPTMAPDVFGFGPRALPFDERDLEDLFGEGGPFDDGGFHGGGGVVPDGLEQWRPGADGPREVLPQGFLAELLSELLDRLDGDDDDDGSPEGGGAGA